MMDESEDALIQRLADMLMPDEQWDADKAEDFARSVKEGVMAFGFHQGWSKATNEDLARKVSRRVIWKLTKR